MVDREEFQRWRADADQALAVARLQAGAGFHNWACFLAEQAAQLAVKGFLHGVGRSPWGHDLVVLGRSLAEVLGDAWPAGMEDSMARLSRHYIPARYPDAHPSGPTGAHYALKDAEEAIREADAILALIDRSWREVSEEAEP